MAGTFVTPPRMVKAARNTATKIEEDALAKRDERLIEDESLATRFAVALGWKIFADEIEQDAKANGYWT
jgi:CRISPR/Cas system type I-B associated protein Csh2 (Cas7 group RAMP superfamily)